MPANRPVLVINAGSSSIKAAVLDPAFDTMLRAEASGIGTRGRLRAGGSERDLPLPDHKVALTALLQGLAASGLALADLRAVAHRVVHGGANLTAPVRVTPGIRAEIAACFPLAPLHNPHNLAAIETIAELAPDLPQTASFDTAFHATIPEVARRYALPDCPETEGIRRYGFHGISYAALTRVLTDRLGTLPPRLLALHLGNGASLCAIAQGRSVATTMGYSPVSGVTMGTRCGDIDAGAVLHLAERLGTQQAHHLLHHRAGLLGLSGLSADMRELEQAGTPEAEFAIAHFCYWAARHAGSMIVAMGGVDAIAFTGGIGENATTIRATILNHLSWLGEVPTWIVPAEEEAQIARDAIMLLAQEDPTSFSYQ